MGEFGAGEERDGTRWAEELHRCIRVRGGTVGAQEGAGSNQVVSKLVIFTDITLDGLGFVGKE